MQRRFTKRVIGLSNLDYEERLRKIKLPSLEYRRLRGDMIEVYKIVHKIYDPCTTQTLLTPSGEDITRGHKYKLTKTFTNMRSYQKFFTSRVTNEWNKLPPEAVSASSLNAFKHLLDNHMEKHWYSTELSEL